MVSLIVLDAGPLGMAVSPRPSLEFQGWYSALTRAGAKFVVPEIADFEVRRELVRAGLLGSIEALDRYLATIQHAPITTPIMRRAAKLWAETRNRGRPLTDRHALDADVILAATAEAVAARGNDVIVATTNLAHLSSLTNAALWSEIRG